MIFTLYKIEERLKMNNIAEIKQDLIHRLEILKNQYPDCSWLKECINMNKHCTLTLDMRLVPNVEEKYFAFISNN